MNKKIVLGILAAAVLIGAGIFVRQKQRADQLAQNAAVLVKIEQNMMVFRMHNGRFPAQSEGIEALSTAPASAPNWRGPYLKDENLKDIWGHEVQYEILDAQTFRLKSAGPDGSFDTTDDIAYPQATQ